MQLQPDRQCVSAPCCSGVRAVGQGSGPGRSYPWTTPLMHVVCVPVNWPHLLLLRLFQFLSRLLSSLGAAGPGCLFWWAGDLYSHGSRSPSLCRLRVVLLAALSPAAVWYRFFLVQAWYQEGSRLHLGMLGLRCSSNSCRNVPSALLLKVHGLVLVVSSHSFMDFFMKIVFNSTRASHYNVYTIILYCVGKWAHQQHTELLMLYNKVVLINLTLILACWF